MDMTFHIKADFAAVYLLNGTFCERADNILYEEKPLYITVLPLNAMLLPYTAKILGGKVLENELLVRVYSLQHNKFYVRLAPRYNYVYSPMRAVKTEEGGEAARFFRLLKSNSFTAARELLTPNLSESVSDADLSAFFNEYEDIVTNPEGDDYYLINSAHEGTMFKIYFRDGLIDNFEEAAND